MPLADKRVRSPGRVFTRLFAVNCLLADPLPGDGLISFAPPTFSRQVDLFPSPFLNFPLALLPSTNFCSPLYKTPSTRHYSNQLYTSLPSRQPCAIVDGLSFSAPPARGKQVKPWSSGAMALIQNVTTSKSPTFKSLEKIWAHSSAPTRIVR